MYSMAFYIKMENFSLRSPHVFLVSATASYNLQDLVLLMNTTTAVSSQVSRAFKEFAIAIDGKAFKPRHEQSCEILFPELDGSFNSTTSQRWKKWMGRANLKGFPLSNTQYPT
ncbi:uncharacterized protein PHALS_14917 [Plasmopara halstedii]|uniref:Uncharacterized protein n=1 Tax=Plasmopara halstedii TaxID=4781 RepID=A0A0P1AXB4_PLAHL|nr:uncharacterized protein PHALS_14917 [Plasmopara halstedii]CEG46677.1 hypothetical protein PHALS_14917 [Plasmopara halstedii]|eukprot:XP_024583046.1 hypothetical protein PHALS_14917 [Plasmopara halstedii]